MVDIEKEIKTNFKSGTKRPWPCLKNLIILFQRSVDDVSYLGCLSSVPSMQMVLFLDHICVDCFNLYNEIEIYSYCR